MKSEYQSTIDNMLKELKEQKIITTPKPHETTIIPAKVDTVNHPPHYKSGGIETIDYMKAKMVPIQFEGYLIGNILKYVSRFQFKNGVEDLRKAQWYLDKLINELTPKEEA